jgi:hypothetical protein
LNVFRLDQIDFVSPPTVDLEIDEIAVSWAGRSVPILSREIVAIAVMAADRAGIGLRIETEDVAPHAVTVWRRRLR